mmetsp:Transcript_24338/g.27159  ORF Transcript_24338/g.27159 Transcript_24338/m.27159 type:complete len:150 (-) Transcript_24338:121-570(-)
MMFVSVAAAAAAVVVPFLLVLVHDDDDFLLDNNDSIPGYLVAITEFHVESIHVVVDVDVDVDVGVDVDVDVDVDVAFELPNALVNRFTLVSLFVSEDRGESRDVIVDDDSFLLNFFLTSRCVDRNKENDIDFDFVLVFTFFLFNFSFLF